MGSKLEESVFAAGGAVGALMRTIDWSATPLGSPDGWPQSLVSILSICLSTRFPIAVYWGPQFILLYNDAWIPLEGNRHPASLGRPASEVLVEAWQILRSSFHRAFFEGEASSAERQFVASSRHGYIEECYFDYGISPIRGEENRIVGLFMPASETTPPADRETTNTVESEHPWAFSTVLRTRLDKIASAAPVAIFEMRTTPEGRLFMPYSTPAIKQIYGHTPEELAADVSRAASLPRPEDRKRIAERLPERDARSGSLASSYCFMTMLATEVRGLSIPFLS